MARASALASNERARRVASNMRNIVILAASLIGLALFAQNGYADSLAKTAVLNWGDDAPHSLDPHTASSTTDTYTRLNLYDSLYKYDGNPPKIIPSLAISYKVSPDHLTWTFDLRKGVKFHDGSKLTAADVVYSFQRVLALKRSPAAPFWPILKPSNIIANGRHEVTFKLEKPYAPFVAALPLVAIVEKSLVEAHQKNGDWAARWLGAHDAGSGPYEAQNGSFIPNEKLVLNWFPGYFMKWGPHPIKRVNISTIREESTMTLALIKGEIDGTNTRISSDSISRLEKAKGVRVVRDQGMRTFVLTMDNQRAPLNNVHVRRAISYAFDYNGYIAKLRGGTVVRNPGPLPINLWGNPPGLKGYSYDPAKAKAEIALARKEGVNLDRTLTVYGFQGTEETDLAMELLQSNLRRIGIKLDIKATLFPTLVSMTSKQSTTPDMWFHWVSATFIDPENWIGQMYDSQFWGNWKASAWYKNPQVNKLLREARTTFDQKKRSELYQRATAIIERDAPALWISNAVEYRGLSDRVRGLKYTPVGSGTEFRTMSLAH